MARSYAQILVKIWSDEEFKALDDVYQHMFFVLLSQPRLNLCGVLDFIPSRLAKCSDSMTADDVTQRVKWLEGKRYVVVDTDTSELLIRSFIRHDGLLKSPKVTVGMAVDYGEIMSPKLRAAIDEELRRARTEDPSMKGWEWIEKTNPVLHRNITG